MLKKRAGLILLLEVQSACAECKNQCISIGPPGKVFEWSRLVLSDNRNKQLLEGC